MDKKLTAALAECFAASRYDVRDIMDEHSIIEQWKADRERVINFLEFYCKKNFDKKAFIAGTECLVWDAI